MRRGFANRVDSTSKALIAHAKSRGWEYLASDGTVDGTLWMPGTTIIKPVDWKSADGLLTPAQQRLLMKKWPIEFVSDVTQLEALIKESR